MNKPVTKETAVGILKSYAGSRVPGVQYIVADADETLFEYAGGWADIKNRKPMTLDITMVAYSMTKTFTAVGILQGVERGNLGLDEVFHRYLPTGPYSRCTATVRQLLDHTSGLPNPIPLRWIHRVEEDTDFDEAAALAQVLGGNSEPASTPGKKFAYSDIGYWLLGKTIEQVTKQSYADYVRAQILARWVSQRRNWTLSSPTTTDTPTVISPNTRS